MSLIRTSILIASLFGADSVKGAGNLLNNGSFEDPLASPGGVLLSTFPAGWSGLGNGSTVDILATGYAGGTAPDGSQFVDLIGSVTFPSGLKQSVHLEAGVGYRFSFQYNGGNFANGQPTTQAFLDYSLGSFVSGTFDVNGRNAFANNGAVDPWLTFTTDFVANSTGDFEVKFLTQAGLAGGPYVDNVSIERLGGTSVPDATSSLSVLGLGLASLGLVRRMGRKA